ncbi:MAG: carboxypeptidase regulatory-like domain-containing protein [Methanobrevibacter sp.]|nr:carboxypeptidase regulatory-like domain-containing protein [Methanobrevibacter sp.]
MDKNKIIIVVLIVIIAALLVGIVSVMPNMAKQDTNLTFKGKSTLSEGDLLKIKLTDLNGTALANQTVNITITDKNNVKYYFSVETNGNGTGKLELNLEPGKYKVTVSYGGNNNYNPSNATKNITIEEEVAEAGPVQNQASSNTHTIMGEDGYYYTVDDNGNILETLGPSQRYYPNNPNSVNYPNAEPGNRYINK